MAGGNWKSIGPRRRARAQRVDHLEEEFGGFAGVLQAQDVGDAHVGLDGEDEAGRGLRDPVLQRRGRGQAAERVVDLHAVQALRVVFQKLVGRGLGRIEARFPGRVCEAGSSGVKSRHGLTLSLAGDLPDLGRIANVVHWIVNWLSARWRSG